MVFLVASVVVVAGAVIALVLGRSGGASVHLSRATSTAGGTGLPDGPLTSDALARVRFDTGLRGYRTDEVDAVLDALVARLAELEEGAEPGDAPGRPAATTNTTARTDTPRVWPARHREPLRLHEGGRHAAPITDPGGPDPAGRAAPPTGPVGPPSTGA